MAKTRAGKRVAANKKTVTKASTKIGGVTITKPKRTVSAETVAVAKPRQLKSVPKRSFRLHKKADTAQPKTAGPFKLFGGAISILVKNWPIFIGIIIIYGILSMILTGSLSALGSSNLAQLKHNMSQFSSFATGLGLFAYLAGSAGFTGSPAGGVTQSLLLIFISLALIWALRQAYAEGHAEPLRIRDAFYDGMTQLVQFIMVLIILLLELVPLTIGALLYVTVVNGGIAITLPEKTIFGVIFFLLAVASFYLITSNIFAVYIVTLEDMTPFKALKAAAGVARYRRVSIFLKLLFLVVTLVVISAIIIIPLAIWVTPAAPYVFFVLTLIFLAIFHSYAYALYRELI